MRIRWRIFRLLFTPGLIAYVQRISVTIAASLGAGIGGVLTGRLCRRLGPVWGFRAVPLSSLPIVGPLLLITIDHQSARAVGARACR